jgi:hypothetical protein
MARVERNIPNNGQTVSVALRLPNDLICKLYKMEDTQEPTPTGHRTVKVAREIKRWTLNGWNHTHLRYKPYEDLNGMNAVPNQVCVPGGQVGLTHNVSKEDMDEWARQNYDSPLLETGTIFWHSDVEGIVRERENDRSGFEPLQQPVQDQQGNTVMTDKRLAKTNLKRVGTAIIR